MTPGEVAAHPGEYTHQLFREMLRVDFVRTTEGATGPFTDRLMIRRNTGGRNIEARLCEPLVYIDGIRTELMPGESLHDAAPRDRIEPSRCILLRSALPSASCRTRAAWC